MQNQTYRRLYWQCRRGMLEVDVLLQRFIKRYYEALSADDLSSFQHLLQQSDQDLFAWFTATAEPEDAELNRMVQWIRLAH